MTVAVWIAFLAGGAFGAPARYVADGYLDSRTSGALPWGTFAVNAAGSLLLGALTGLALHHGLDPDTRTVLGTGFCGAFTTFSTFTFETIRLAEDGATTSAMLNVAANTFVGMMAAGLALALTSL
ncbi:MAG TPA: fluoride efflux transporter CrcB [Acidimicrobiales bacterium]|jgi:CrcB protein|nr:fluoride efflux transporter CrcB [Acidimicrobiales bacterium]